MTDYKKIVLDWKNANLITFGCMRRFALMNFQITTNAYSKLSYTPCYALVPIY
jgi:hypothetical protein